MAAGNAISRSKTSIYIVDANTHPSTLTSASLITGEIINYNLSGGESDSETVSAFGGDITKEKPVSQFELSLEIVPSLASTTASTRWSNLTRVKETIGASTVYTVTNAAATPSVVYPTSKMIVIAAYDSASTIWNTAAYNNADITTFEMDHPADDNRTINMTFKFSPTTTAGKSNVMEASLAPTALPPWTSLN